MSGYGFDEGSSFAGTGGDVYWGQEYSSVGHQPLSAVRNGAQFDNPPDAPSPSSSSSFHGPMASGSMMYGGDLHAMSAPVHGGVSFQGGIRYDAYGAVCNDEGCASSACGPSCGTTCEDPNCAESYNAVHHGPPCDDDECNPDTRCTDDECYPAHANCPPVVDEHFYQPQAAAYHMAPFQQPHNQEHTCIQPCLLHYHHHQGMPVAAQPYQQWRSPTPSSPFAPLPTPVSEPQQQFEASEPQSPVVFKSIENDSGAPRKCCWVTNPQTGAICGEILQNCGDLFQHCNEVHVSEAQRRSPNGKKITGDWTCYWDDCSSRKDGVRKTFKTKSKLERHLQSHAGHKPWKCDICDLELSAKQALDQHRRIHTGEEPFKCTFPNCNKSFKQQSALTMHERTHTGDKPLKCDICNRVFSESSNLAKHRNMHGEPKYPCGYCPKKFHRRDQQKKHEERIHKVAHGTRSSRQGSNSSTISTSLAPSVTPSSVAPASVPLSPHMYYGVGADEGFA